MSINPLAWGQMVPAAQWSLAKLSGRAGGQRSAVKRRRSSKAPSAKRAKVRARKASRSRARLVKGSSAARRYMAKIRKMRKRK